MTANPLAAMMAYPRWILWRAEPDPDKPGKFKKKPLSPFTGIVTDPTDVTHHATYAVAYEALQKGLGGAQGVGFVFVAADPFFFHDIDNCLTPENQWSPLAQDLMRRLAGCAVEISHSGTGLHIFGCGHVPDHSCKNIPLGLELYTDGRFCAITFNGLTGDAGHDAGAAIGQIAADYFPPNEHGRDVANWTAEPRAGWDMTLADDDHLIERATKTGDNNNAAARFGYLDGKARFGDLFSGNDEALAAAYPGNSTGGYDASSVDAALASHLLWWTGHDMERVERLMRRSRIARPKWDERPEYLETTIIGASGVMGEKMATPRPGGMTEEIAASHGLTLRDASTVYMNAGTQADHFGGCVYVGEADKIWSPAKPYLMNKSRFDAMFGGYQFRMNADGSKNEKSAWLAYTQNTQYAPIVADIPCFRPEHPSGAIVDLGGISAVNTYVPIETPRKPGDATKFTAHLAKLCGEDYEIVLTYLASMVRNPGEKFQWCVLLCGAEGNGKTLLATVMRYAIGLRYSVNVKPTTLKKTGDQFNGYVKGNLFLGIEEIYVGQDSDFLDAFKETVTNDWIPVETKGVDAGMGDNRVNILLFTNRPGAIPITANTRRYCIVHNPQQSYEDCLRDGMTEDYFTDLYDWLKGKGAYAHEGPNHGYMIVNEWLRTCAINEAYNPAGARQRAPRTSSYEEAIKRSLSPAEQEIYAAIEEDRPGFAGGWISANKLDELLRQKGFRMTRNAQHDTLEKLGYRKHPRLADGRTNNPVQPDNIKTRLYTTAGHLSQNLESAAAVAEAYSKAQMTAETEPRLPLNNPVVPVVPSR